MRSKLRRALISSSLAALAACSSSKPSSAPPDTAHFASSMAETFCGALHACCDARKLAYDESSCTAELQSVFQTAIDVVKRGKVIYDAIAVAGCEDAIKKRESACAEDAGAPPGPESGNVDPVAAACWPVLKGTVAPGGECADASECQTPDPSVVAICQQDTRSGADLTKSYCYTHRTHAMPGDECRSQPKAGAFELASCEPGLAYCDTSGAPSDDFSAGTCKVYAKVGDDCVGSSPQVTPRCDPQTSYCDYASTKTCLALPQAGQLCATTGLYECAPGLVCDRGGAAPATCVAPKPDGSPCATSQECASQSCRISFDAGVQQSTCAPGGAPAASHDTYDVSPRTCGFGPQGTGPEDAGIVAPAKAQAIAPASAPDSRWWLGVR